MQSRGLSAEADSEGSKSDFFLAPLPPYLSNPGYARIKARLREAGYIPEDIDMCTTIHSPYYPEGPLTGTGASNVVF